MGHVGASRKSPIDSSLSQRLNKADPLHWSGHLQTPDTGQGTCRPLPLVREPADPWHWSGHLQTPDTGQDVEEERPWLL